QHALQSAFAVQNLCGFDTAAFIPASIKDPLQRQAYTDDLYTLLATHDDIERGKDLAGSAEGGLVDIGAMPTLSAAQAVFKTTWGHLPDREKWQVALEDWNAKRLWREDVRFDEVQTYLSQTTRDALRLQRHCQHSEQDLLTWLNQLDPNAEAIYHDT
ncbi:T6SS effector BTH_I2691 family protein, partial [Pseudomonas sp. SDO528_S397]